LHELKAQQLAAKQQREILLSTPRSPRGAGRSPRPDESSNSNASPGLKNTNNTNNNSQKALSPNLKNVTSRLLMQTASQKARTQATATSFISRLKKGAAAQSSSAKSLEDRAKNAISGNNNSSPGKNPAPNASSPSLMGAARAGAAANQSLRRGAPKALPRSPTRDVAKGQEVLARVQGAIRGMSKERK